MNIVEKLRDGMIKGKLIYSRCLIHNWTTDWRESKLTVDDLLNKERLILNNIYFKQWEYKLVDKETVKNNESELKSAFSMLGNFVKGKHILARFCKEDGKYVFYKCLEELIYCDIIELVDIEVCNINAKSFLQLYGETRIGNGDVVLYVDWSSLKISGYEVFFTAKVNGINENFSIDKFSSIKFFTIQLKYDETNVSVGDVFLDKETNTLLCIKPDWFANQLRYEIYKDLSDNYQKVEIYEIN
jgi:hypothetical protein